MADILTEKLGFDWLGIRYLTAEGELPEGGGGSNPPDTGSGGSGGGSVTQPVSDPGVLYAVFNTVRGSPVLARAPSSAGGNSSDILSNSNGDPGASVSSGGDINGDGLADYLVTITAAGSSADAARAYVLFGRSSTETFELSKVVQGSSGFVITGACISSITDSSIYAVGDIDGDGFADLAFGVAGPEAGSFKGRATALLGGATGALRRMNYDRLGTTGADALSDGGAMMVILGNAGSDTITLYAGGSIAMGGLGDDVIGIGAAMINSLSSPLGQAGNTNQLAHIDGGVGIDTLRLDGRGLTLELGAISARDVNSTADGMRLSNLEKIDITGSGNNVLTLSANDVRKLGQANSFVQNGRIQILVNGDNDDTLRFVDNGWTMDQAGLSYGGSLYNVYLNSAAQVNVLVKQAVASRMPVVSMSQEAMVNSGGGIRIGAPDVWNAQYGMSVSNAGDINDDGYDDFIVGGGLGARLGDHCYVVFGRPGGGTLNVGGITSGGGWFEILDSRFPNAFVASTATGVGDVNADGKADIVVRTGNGAHLIFGKATDTTVDLASIGSAGFSMLTATAGESTGLSLSAAGDINGDGRADILIGAYSVDGQAGRSYIVYGKANSNTVALKNLGSAGITIIGEAGALTGLAVSAGGDINGDGLPDVIIGTVQGGRTYVVFGQTASAPVNLASIAAGNGGYLIDGLGTAWAAAQKVSYAGDVNGDGLADLIIGNAAMGSMGTEGQSYVVFGKASTGRVDLRNIIAGVGGFAINGDTANDRSGSSVSYAGDVNGDGLADVLVGAPQAADSADHGKSYIVFGKPGGSEVNLSDVASGTGGILLVGGSFDRLNGASVSSGGDVNGDGIADVLIGTPGATTTNGMTAISGGDTNSGAAYVMYGAANGIFNKTAIDYLGGAGNDVVDDAGYTRTLVTGQGDDVVTLYAGGSIAYTGAGNDRITINANVISALQSPLGSGGNYGQLTRIDGGSGNDTLQLSGANLQFYLTSVANQAGQGLDGGSRIESIERFDITGSGNNTLIMRINDVLDMADVNNYLTIGRHDMIVEGDKGDKVLLGDGWGKQDYTTKVDGIVFDVWFGKTALTAVLVERGLTVLTF